MQGGGDMATVATVATLATDWVLSGPWLLANVANVANVATDWVLSGLWRHGDTGDTGDKIRGFRLIFVAMSPLSPLSPCRQQSPPCFFVACLSINMAYVPVTANRPDMPAMGQLCQ